MRKDDGTEIPCAVCGARDTRRLYTKFEWGIERCRQCGLVYANPRAPEAEILRRYNREYFWNEYLPAAGVPGGRIDLDFIDGRNANMLTLIRKHAPEGRSLLEVGSGAGLFLKAAARAGWRVGGLELSEAGAEFARDTLGLDVRLERAETMSFPAASFDVAVMFDVIEHLFEPRAVLEATRRALTPGGVIVITTPNFDAISRFALGVDWATLSPLEHVYYFTEQTLRRLLEISGFGDVQFEARLPDRQAVETMNYRSTHAPNSPRKHLYRLFVQSVGRGIYGAVQRAGRGDALLCFGTAK